MSRYALIHNPEVTTQDIVLRADVSGDVVERLRNAHVDVVGGESVTMKPGGTVTLARMQPAEDRWVSITYSPPEHAEGASLPVSFSQMAGEKVVNGFTFGIKPAPIERIMFDNLDWHYGIYTRIANQLGIGQAKAEAAAAKGLLRDKDICSNRYLHSDRYMQFLAQHVRPAGAVINAVLAQHGSGDPFGIRPALKQFDDGVHSVNLARAAAAHMALLEKLDSFVLMLQLRNGNPADVLQMVRWQQDLYSTVPQLKDLPVSSNVVKESQEFIDGYGKRTRHPEPYPELIRELGKSFRETADALAKAGVDVKGEAAKLQRHQNSIAALEKAHREYLLKLNALRR